MAHIVSEVASAELDDIWYYFAKQSGSIERADWMVDSITERFYTLSAYPRIGRKKAGLTARPAQLQRRQLHDYLSDRRHRRRFDSACL